MNSSPFWLNQPSILLAHRHLLEVYPLSSMSLESKLNAMTRLVILVTLLSLLLTTSHSHVVAIGLVMLVLLAGYYFMKRVQFAEGFRQKEKDTGSAAAAAGRKEQKDKDKQDARTIGQLSKLEDTLGLDSIPAKDRIHIRSSKELDKVMQDEFHPTDKRNPFGNVLLTDIGDQPERRAARPSFNPNVVKDIDTAVRKQTQMLNPTIQGTTRQLFGDLKDQYDLDNSMQRFHSTANTRVANDQGAFADFLFGTMPSSKGSSFESGIQRIKDGYRYILI